MRYAPAAAAKTPQARSAVPSLRLPGRRSPIALRARLTWMTAELVRVALSMGERIGQTLVPDGLWKIVEPLIPPQAERPQGGGTRYRDDRAVFTAIVYVLRAGGAWRQLPAEVGVSPATAHRRFAAWTEAGLWRRLHRAVLDRLGAQAAVDWSRAVVDAASVRAKKRGALTGPNPVDRGKPGSKLHVLTDAAGLPQAVPAIRCRRGPRRERPAKLHADTGYDYDHLRAWLRARGITPRIARRGVETSTRLGRHRWIIERSFAWLTGYHRLTIRYERSARLFTAFLTLAATLTCYKKLAR